jgi:CheY-like chemotaxis protein
MMRRLKRSSKVLPMCNRSYWRFFATRAIFIVLVFSVILVSGGRADVAPPPTVPDAQAASAVRDYTELLKAEAQGLREAAESDSRRLDRTLTTFNWIVGVVGAIFVFGAGVFGSLLVFASRASKKDIDEEVSKQMQARVEREINARIDQIVNPAIEGLRKTIEERVNTVKEDLADVRTGITEAAADSKLPAVAQENLSTKRIIWLDDQPNTTKTARNELEKRGITVDAVESSDELEGKVRQKRYDLIVSDMRRDGNPRAGLDYFQKIRADAERNRQWPPRILFAPQSLMNKVRDEIDGLVQNGGGKFLSPVTSPERFFEAVLKALGQT